MILKPIGILLIFNSVYDVNLHCFLFFFFYPHRPHLCHMLIKKIAATYHSSSEFSDINSLVNFSQFIEEGSFYGFQMQADHDFNADHSRNESVLIVILAS